MLGTVPITHDRVVADCGDLYKVLVTRPAGGSRPVCYLRGYSGGGGDVATSTNQASEQAGKQASRQASKQAGKQASKPAIDQPIKQSSTQSINQSIDQSSDRAINH